MKIGELLKNRQENRDRILEYVGVTVFGLEGGVRLNLNDGDLWMIFGTPKSGKTTLLLNYVLRLALKSLPITVCCTEPVMTSEMYALRLLALLATLKLREDEFFNIPISAEVADRVLLNDEKVIERVPDVAIAAIFSAVDILSELDVSIYSASGDGGRINLVANMVSLMGEVNHPHIFAIDQINQIVVPGGLDYKEAPIRAVSIISEAAKEHKLATITVAQISTTSFRLSETGVGIPIGGFPMLIDTSLGLQPMIQRGGKMSVRADWVRNGPPFMAVYDIEYNSGLLFGGEILTEDDEE